ncbi:hypothetical protein E3N88_02308 [Mikania micrantha]|uniref:ARID domain-containing protein n=1 Tax=Mikania micrantha TaxID=192012 RepID=A0A5N6Q3M3_9ASTR|nr:hypothetical protein E3N88_02308 [Mikania micrantha]
MVFKRIGQPDSKRYPPMLPNVEKVELLDLYMFVKAAGGYKNIDNEKWNEIGHYMGISTPYVVNVRPIFVGYLELFLFFYDRFKYEEKEAFVEKKIEAKKEGKSNTVMEENVVKNDNMGNSNDENVIAETDVIGSVFAIEPAVNTAEKMQGIQIYSQEGSFGNDDEFFEDLDDFVIIKDEDPPNEA